jgi:hydrogenase nickel incorporation protein HypA/HybF
MHEFGLCEAIVDAVCRRAAGRRVARVRVRIGAMHRVDKESFRQGFSWAGSETEAANAAVDLIVTAVRAVCASCQTEATFEESATLCPRCGAADMNIVQGNELILESIEYAEESTPL